MQSSIVCETVFLVGCMWLYDEGPHELCQYDECYCMGHAGMQKFAEKAATAKIVGNWLELPEGTYFLGDAELGSILYVHKAYRLLRLALRRAKSKGFRHVVVSGNPGVGKSYFAIFMLVW